VSQTSIVSRCPICKAEAEPRARNRTYPFCSPRCQLVDLSKWLEGDYRVPVAPQDGYGEVPPDGHPDDD
jgi:uncharacterized protein